jgi:hypothetical protein
MTDEIRYHLWIVLVSTTFEGDIISALTKRGYSVSAASGSETCLTFDNSPCAVFSVRLSKPGITSVSVHDDAYTILNGLGAKVYSLIVSEYSKNSVWNGPNFWATDTITERTEIEHKKRMN